MQLATEGPLQVMQLESQAMQIFFSLSKKLLLRHPASQDFVSFLPTLPEGHLNKHSFFSFKKKSLEQFSTHLNKLSTKSFPSIQERQSDYVAPLQVLQEGEHFAHS